MKPAYSWIRVALVSCLLGAVLCACAPKRPPVVLPKWEPLPAVAWKADGKRVCTEDFDALVKRERLRELRERTYLEMLKALGAVEAPVR